MHSTSTEITDRSARRTMKGRGSATSFSSIMLDKSVILLIQKMPLLCVHRFGLAALAPSFFTFQRGEGPLLVALGFVKKDTADLTIPVLDLLDSRVETGVAACKESEELVVTVSWLAAACLRTQPFNRKDEEQQHPELTYYDVGTTRPVVEASRETPLHRSDKSSLQGFL